MSDENTLWRAQSYALLARLLSAAPDLDLLNNIAAIEVTEPESPMGEMWLPLINAAQKAESEAVKEAFDTLFIGITHGELIPYASFYRTGFLMEEPLAELRSDLAKLGLERQTDITEPEDHIAAICDVMRLILTAEGTPIVTSSEFFKRHIAPWGEQFFNDLASSHVAEFYTALGQFGLRFISLEARL